MTFFARLKHDVQLARWGYKARSFPGTLAYIPETFPFEDHAAGDTKGAAVKLTNKWYAFDKDLTAPANNWVMAVGAMLFNNATNPQLSQLISSGGNVVELDSFSNLHGHVVSFQNSIFAGSPAVNYHDTPQLVHKVVCVKHDGTLANPGANKDSYYCIIGNPDLWVNMADVELFPPFGVVKVKLTTIPWLNVRDAPEGAVVVDHLLPGASATVTEYAVRGSNVWGKISTGWIGILVHNWYRTSWHMATMPPIFPQS